MEPISLGFVISSFIAGILTFLAPCTLPLVPAYLGFISGVDEDKLQSPKQAPEARKMIFKNGLFFIVGFSLVFIIFGTLAGLVGQALAPWRLWLTRIGGVFVILFGLYMLGVFKLPIFSSKNLRAPSWITLGKPSSSFAIGGAFAFGWTPCVGPILGSILLLAATEATAFTGGVMLAVFSVGLAIPFLLLAAAYSRSTKYIEKISSKLHVISIIGGIFLLILGALLVTDSFSLLIQYGYEIFDFINYEGLLDYL